TAGRYRAELVHGAGGGGILGDAWCLIPCRGDLCRQNRRSTPVRYAAPGALFSYLSRDAMVPQDHPLRVIRRLVNMALARLSAEHCWVDGRLSEAWASMKSFRPRDGGGEPPRPGRNGERDFHGEQRSNETHASTTDPDARLYRKARGQAAKLCYMGHLLME